MAVTPVTLGPTLRAWSLAGVTHILCDGPVDPVYLGNDAPAVLRPTAPASMPPRADTPSRVASIPGTGKPAPARAATPAQETGEPTPTAPAPSATNVADRANSVSATGGQSPTAVTSGSASLAFAARHEAPANPADWPGPWSSWFGRVAPAPVLWTYHELGADLTGIGRSLERSAFFKNLITELGLPKGSSVFWPSAMPMAEAEGEAAPVANPAVFAAGLARLGPQVVIVFGEAALADMGLAGRIRPFRQEMVEGKLLLCLPEITTLLRNQTQRGSAVSLLRAVLSSVAFG